MSTAIDANLLLYASDASSRFHRGALETLERLTRGPELFYLFWPVVMAYLRIATNPSIFADPKRPEEAIADTERLLSLGHCRTAGEQPGFWEMFRITAADTVVRGNLVSDVHLVALMRQNGVGTIWTHDRDFRKFEGIRVRDPFA